MTNLMKVVILLVLFGHATKARHASLHHHHDSKYIHPSKRIEIPHPDKNDNRYIESKSYRRQEVIHALDEDSATKTDDNDDIESLGKAIDSTGAEIKSASKKEAIVSDVTGASRDIIAKIKEIQDKLFKRTGSKELEAKLKQMSPEVFPAATVPVQAANTLTRSNDSTGKQNTTNDSSKEKLKNEMKLSDGSKNADRRKIIPEEVVDKILEKFQQLRQEAKHMAFLETNHEAEGGNQEGKLLQASKGPANPYASIGPAKENAELKNRTTQNTDVTTVGMDSKADISLQQSAPDPPVSMPSDITNNGNTGSIQIPIGNTAAAINQDGNAKQSPGVPLMFIKNGQMLVPVFGAANGHYPVTVTGNGMAQLNTNSGVALPNMPNNIVPMANPQQLVAAFMGNQNPLQDSPMSQFMNQANVLNLPSNSPYVPLPTIVESPASRCAIPGSSCPTPTQALLSNQQQYINGQVPAVDNSPSTTDLIKNIMNAPGFPQLAARLMSEQATYQNGNRNVQTGDSRAFTGMIRMPSMTTIGPMSSENPMESGNVQGISPGSIQFGLQQNLASNVPGQISMLQHQLEGPDSNDLQRAFTSMQTQRNVPLSENPFQDVHPEGKNNMDQMQRENQLFNAQNMATNDISDPTPDMDQGRERFQHQSPDQLLDFARYKSFESNLRPENEPEEEGPRVPNVDPIRMDPTKMSTERGGTERSILSGVDPSSLLDRIHGAQLKVDLMGAGDPNWFSPTRQRSKTERPYVGLPDSGTPDDLLEMLRGQNDKMFNKNYGMDNPHQEEFSRERLREERMKESGRIPISVDPSLADEIPDNDGFNQPFDVQSKQVAADNIDDNQFMSRNQMPGKHGDISVLSDDFVQYKHGRMSMDSANVVNSFFRDPEYYRNGIAHPQNGGSNTNTKLANVKPIVRASIARTLPEDNVELRVNGKTLTDKSTLRSKIVNGKIVKPNGKTFSSKGPIQIELSHGQDKRKIINIMTKSKYNVTEERRRMQIPKLRLVSD